MLPSPVWNTSNGVWTELAPNGPIIKVPSRWRIRGSRRKRIAAGTDIMTLKMAWHTGRAAWFVSNSAIARHLAVLALSLLAASSVVRAQSAPPAFRSGTDKSHSDKFQAAADSGTAEEASPPSLFTPLKPQSQESPYVPITPRQRLRWFLTNTIGPAHLAGGTVTSAFGTALNRPEEYGPHWAGMADRYGMRMTGIVTGNAIEAGAGLLLGEDPRYFRVRDRPFRERLRNVVRLTFYARTGDGSYRPAYARYAAIAGNNFLSNTWRVHSEANTHDALLRTAEGFAGHMAFNAFEEFWPDVTEFLLHRRR